MDVMGSKHDNNLSAHEIAVYILPFLDLIMAGILCSGMALFYLDMIFLIQGQGKELIGFIFW